MGYVVKETIYRYINGQMHTEVNICGPLWSANKWLKYSSSQAWPVNNVELIIIEYNDNSFEYLVCNHTSNRLDQVSQLSSNSLLLMLSSHCTDIND